MKPMTVGQVARRAGVGVETVRFYEKHGLLEVPARRASGYREYDEGTVNRLRFIRRAKELGFALSEIRELLSLRCSERPCNDVRQRAEAKVAEIEAKVALLLRMKEVLGRLASSCCQQGDKSRCPILDALDLHEVLADRGGVPGACREQPAGQDHNLLREGHDLRRMLGTGREDD